MTSENTGTERVLGFLGGVTFTAAITAVALATDLQATPPTFAVMAGTALVLGVLIQHRETQEGGR